MTPRHTSTGLDVPAPDFDAAIGYALRRLEHELPPELTYHNLWHTAQDVLPAVQRLAALMGVDGTAARLLEVAAAYHDIGFVAQSHEHERVSAEIAAAVLPRFGFSPEQVAAVQGMILATRLPQSPRTPLEEIMGDADLDVLGREDALARGEALRAELAALGQPMSEVAWAENQLAFQRAHCYFTAAARALRDAGKARNIIALEEKLRQARPHGRSPSSSRP